MVIFLRVQHWARCMATRKRAWKVAIESNNKPLSLLFQFQSHRFIHSAPKEGSSAQLTCRRQVRKAIATKTMATAFLLFAYQQTHRICLTKSMGEENTHKQTNKQRRDTQTLCYDSSATCQVLRQHHLIIIQFIIIIFEPSWVHSDLSAPLENVIKPKEAVQMRNSAFPSLTRILSAGLLLTSSFYIFEDNQENQIVNDL